MFGIIVLDRVMSSVKGRAGISAPESFLIVSGLACSYSGIIQYTLRQLTKTDS